MPSRPLVILALVGPVSIGLTGSVVYAFRFIACPDEWLSWIVGSACMFAWWLSAPAGVGIGFLHVAVPAVGRSMACRTLAWANAGTAGSLAVGIVVLVWNEEREDLPGLAAALLIATATSLGLRLLARWKAYDGAVSARVAAPDSARHP